MFSKLSKRFTYTNIALTIAIVFAMTGGAYAASKVIITSTKQISPKVVKELKGKAGAKGAVGAVGAAGPAGPAGPVGPAGPAGSGTPGTAGKEGTPGKDGEKGETGSPWVAGGTLPGGQSEKGVWGVAGYSSSGGTVIPGSISFTIPLSKEPTPVLIKEGEEGTGKGSGCPEKSSASKPAAEPGFLCVFVTATEGNVEFLFDGILPPFENPEASEPGEVPGKAGKSGALVGVLSQKEASVFADGTWAVTE